MSWFPVCVVFEHGIECDEKLSHAGNVDDFEGFAGVFESFGEGFDGRVRSFCGEGGHVEILANGFSAAADGAFALEPSAVVIERSEAAQCGNFLPVEFSEFREIGDECSGGGRTDSRGAAEDVFLVVPVIVGFEEFEDGVLDLFDLFIELIDDILDAGADFLDGTGFESIFFGSTELDELSAACDALCELGLFFRRFSHGTGTNLLSEAGDDAGVNPVGFGEDAECLSEVSDLAGIDDGNFVSGIQQFRDESSLIPPGGFDNDEAGFRSRKPLKELLEAALVVAEGDRTSLRKETDIEGMFGHIDADERVEIIHGKLPVLPMRARQIRHGSRTAPAAVRVNSTKPTTILLQDGLRRPRLNRSVVGGLGGGCSASLRSLLQGVFHLTIQG